MLALLICNCHNSETFGRRALKEAGVERWLSVPAHKGRGAGLTFCDKLAEYCDDAVPVAELRQYLIARSSYVVVVGYTKKGLLWADYGNGKTKGAVRARAIAEQFASPVE